jgi:ribulose-phosphate 3-epimerase
VGWQDWVRDAEIEPSLYAADFARLGEQIDVLLDAGVRVFHFDVGDGHFVEPITIGPIVLESIADLVHERGAALDCHLMVNDPDKHIPQIARAGGDSVTFHVEVRPEPGATIELARKHGLGVGLACNPGTPVGALAEAASAGADLALCMSIEPGYSGQQFMPEALPRIRELRERLPSEIHVQVDGGVGRDNVRDVHEAGANLLVAGSAIFGREELAWAYRQLRQALA